MRLKNDLKDAKYHLCFNSGQLPALAFVVFFILIVSGLFISSCSLIAVKEPEIPITIPKEKGVIIPMEVTAYCGCQKCCLWKRSIFHFFMPVYIAGPNKGKRKQVGITADGSTAARGVIAADLTRYSFGTAMYVPGYGWGEVHDTGSGLKENHIEVFFKSHQDALEWGRKKLKVRVVKKTKKKN